MNMKFIQDKTRLRRHYLNLITKAVEENGNVKYSWKSTKNKRDGLEIHHITPRSWGGSNRPENLVYLTYRQHYLAHLLLSWLCGGEMSRAFAVMCHRFADGKKVRINARQFQLAKESVSESMKGKPSRSQGYVFTDEQLKRLSDALTGRKLSEEQKQKMSEAKKGKSRDEATKRKISETIKGVPKPTGICEHCKREFGLNMLGRWHGDRCPERVK